MKKSFCRYDRNMIGKIKIFLLSILFLILTNSLKSQSFTKDDLTLFATMSMLSDMRNIDLSLIEKKFKIYQTGKSSDGKQNIVTYKSKNEASPELFAIYKNVVETNDIRLSFKYITVSDDWYNSYKKQLMTDTMYHYVSDNFVDGTYRTTYTNYLFDVTFYVLGEANKQSNWNCVFFQPSK